MNSVMSDYLNDNVFDDYIYNLIRTFEDTKSCLFTELELAEVRSFSKFIFDRFEPYEDPNSDNFKEIEKFTLKTVGKVVDLMTFTIIFKLEELRLLQELSKDNSE